MPRQGGQGKGKPKLKDRGFGKALQKKHVQGSQGMSGVSTREKGNLISILDNSSLDDFVSTAIMDGREIEVKRVHKNHAFLVEPTIHTNMQTLSMAQYDFEHLKIPRKPSWTKDMTAEEVDMREREAFLNWRREIASMENTVTHARATPFEKNLEVWRQLWRVIERCDIAIQIVDGRNPLLYYSRDLVAYAAEHSPPRPMMILVNKADFLTERQRRVWAEYLTQMGIKFAFYSAHREQEKIDAAAASKNTEATSPRGNTLEYDDMDIANSIVRDLTTLSLEERKPQKEQKTESLDTSKLEFVWGDMDTQSTPIDGEGSEPTSNTSTIPSTSSTTRSTTPIRLTHVLTREELIHLMSNLPGSLGVQPQQRHRGRVCVGLVGFPNVGKSSVINSILGVSKSSHGVHRVAVSSTPGKTKHFQTLDVNENLMLCDCPGLVFPSFMSSKADMLCSGVLPINQMRDYVEPANIIASRVPQHLLEAAYGIRIKRELDMKDSPDRPPTAHELLSSFCAVRGYITSGTGRWDEFRACKEILRDFNDGKILFVVPPPSISFDTNKPDDSKPSADDKDNKVCDVTMEEWLSDIEQTMARREKVATRIAQQKLRAIEEAEAAGPIVGAQGDMVFGDAEGYDVIDPTCDDFEYVDGDAGGSVADSTSTSTGREHKRLKHWGKKNRKLRQKNPYGEDDSTGISYTVHTTNRTGIVSGRGGGSSKPSRSKRQDPHFNHKHETSYVRAQPIPAAPEVETKNSSSVTSQK
mmetsp:Transcript_21545/g.31305  ORF Transcript_21545/g.31305 Transcript_21545/m.31305 type:complete len:753 (-) Transcript_21545:167-2425(-)|eukprot:CAMPEP_0185038068 /NCGR_PEP_ID=MMETSP1103-20130426/33260_1 /TAXON_ID=36769 /ORGANISM="Paraphysomonas bandaiensis, Strain Caron Lab Isolate" /LENGTH=752 /DNA_ID=CAMNT_0027576337 /DNA_START=43 /DNA_END=2301 /DNA_ORIENTATION=+